MNNPAWDFFFDVLYNRCGGKMKKIEAIIFDMDGLMFDTEKLWIDAVIRANKEDGYQVPIELAVECIGKRTMETDKLLADKLKINSKDYRKIINKYMDEDIKENGLRIKKGLVELLDYLKNTNIKLAIASSSEGDYVKDKLKEANIDEKLFTSIIGGDMVKIPKPDPYIYLKSCEILNVKPENTICLEDSDYGIRSAYDAGLIPILIPDIKKPTEDTLRMAYKKVDDLLDIIDLLKS